MYASPLLRTLLPQMGSLLLGNQVGVFRYFRLWGPSAMIAFFRVSAYLRCRYQAETLEALGSSSLYENQDSKKHG